jgi:hypothetical protein
MAEPLKATFFAFRRRERRGVLWRAFVVHAFNAVSLTIIMIGSAVFYGRGLVGGQTLASRFGAAPLIGGLLLLLLLCQLNAASYDAACLRWFIRGERKGFLGSSFDGDAWRIVLGEVLWAVLLFACALLSGILAGVVAAFAHGMSAEILIPTMAFSLLGIAWFLLAVRLSAANAIGFAKRKFAFFDAVQVSRGRFWSLLGSWLIVSAIWILVFLAIFFMIGFASYSMWRDDTQTAQAAATLGLVAAVASARFVMTPLIMGINARAVLAAADEGKIDGFRPTASVARVFE